MTDLFYWKSILFLKTDTKKRLLAHIVQFTGGEKQLLLFFSRSNFFWAFFPPSYLLHRINPQFLKPQYIHKPHPVAAIAANTVLPCHKTPKKCWLLSLKSPKFCCFWPFVEFTQLLWHTRPARCTIPSFLILKLNSRTEIFLAQIHLVCQKLIGFIHLLDTLSNFMKNWKKKKKHYLLPTNQ